MPLLILQCITLLLLGNTAVWWYAYFLYSTQMGVWQMAKFPLFAIACAAGFFWLNPQILYRIKRGDPSAVTDVLYMAVQLGGFYRLAGMFFAYAIACFWEWPWRWQWMAERDVVTQLVAAVVVLSFLDYWHHRVMHMGELFVFHSVHHSATTFNAITTFRVHIFDALGGGVCMFMGTAFLGLNPSVATAYMIGNLIYQMWVHTDAYAPSWVTGWVITPQEHRIHHSFEPEDFDTNFSTLTIWDRVFGTYKPVK